MNGNGRGLLLTATALAAVVACRRDAPPPPEDGANAPPVIDTASAAPMGGPVATPAATPTPVPDERWGVVRLPDGGRYRTTVYDHSVIGQLKTVNKHPFYIMSGRGCVDCDANLSIYIHSPSDGPMGVEGEQSRFPYPGRETFYEDGRLEYEGRMFYGDCAAAHPNAALWFQRRPDHAGRWRSSVLIAQVAADTLGVTTLESGGPALEEVQAAVRRGTCRELPGIDRASEP